MLTFIIRAALAVQPPSEAASALPPISCTSREHGQFDFWLGEWDVRPAKGARGPVGRNRIEKVLDGCAIHERFSAAPRTGGTAYQGSSYSSYDVHERRWRQYYVDTSGRATWFQGGSNGEGIILWAMEQAPAGSYIRRMEVLPQPDGSVRQKGYVSIDNGNSWRAIYDLVYRRVSGRQ